MGWNLNDSTTSLLPNISFLHWTKWLHSTNMWRTVRIHWQCSHWGGGSFLKIYEWVRCVWPMWLDTRQHHPSCTAWWGLPISHTMDGTHHGRHTPRTAHTTDGTHHGRHTPWRAHTMDGTHHGRHTPWTAHTMDGTHHRRPTPWTAHTMDGTHHGRHTPQPLATPCHTYRSAAPRWCSAASRPARCAVPGTPVSRSPGCLRSPSRCGHSRPAGTKEMFYLTTHSTHFYITIYITPMFQLLIFKKGPKTDKTASILN